MGTAGLPHRASSAAIRPAASRRSRRCARRNPAAAGRLVPSVGASLGMQKKNHARACAQSRSISQSTPQPSRVQRSAAPALYRQSHSNLQAEKRHLPLIYSGCSPPKRVELQTPEWGCASSLSLTSTSSVPHGCCHWYWYLQRGCDTVHPALAGPSLTVLRYTLVL